MAKSNTIAKAARIAEQVSALQPQIAILLTAVKGGYLAYESIRAIFKDAGHDTDTCNGIIAECDKHIAMWQNAHF